MKRTKRIKLLHATRRKKLGYKVNLVPSGYYKNRPKVLAKMLNNGMGRIDTVTFIETKELISIYR